MTTPKKRILDHGHDSAVYQPHFSTQMNITRTSVITRIIMPAFRIEYGRQRYVFETCENVYFLPFFFLFFCWCAKHYYQVRKKKVSSLIPIRFVRYVVLRFFFLFKFARKQCCRIYQNGDRGSSFRMNSSQPFGGHEISTTYASLVIYCYTRYLWSSVLLRYIILFRDWTGEHFREFNPRGITMCAR